MTVEQVRYAATTALKKGKHAPRESAGFQCALRVAVCITYKYAVIRQKLTPV
jgi:hypothetical protein